MSLFSQILDLMQAMEVDEKPKEDYSDIGGLDKQIQELVEAIVLPVTHKDRFKSLGIKPPKGVLLYGPPGTGEQMSYSPQLRGRYATAFAPSSSMTCKLLRPSYFRIGFCVNLLSYKSQLSYKPDCT